MLRGGAGRQPRRRTPVDRSGPHSQGPGGRALEAPDKRGMADRIHPGSSSGKNGKNAHRATDAHLKQIKSGMEKYSGRAFKGATHVSSVRRCLAL